MMRIGRDGKSCAVARERQQREAQAATSGSDTDLDISCSLSSAGAQRNPWRPSYTCLSLSAHSPSRSRVTMPCSCKAWSSRATSRPSVLPSASMI